MNELSPEAQRIEILAQMFFSDKIDVRVTDTPDGMVKFRALYGYAMVEHTFHDSLPDSEVRDIFQLAIYAIANRVLRAK